MHLFYGSVFLFDMIGTVEHLSDHYILATVCCYMCNATFVEKIKAILYSV